MKAMVLCSGGVDSTTCLGIAVDKYGAENVVALSIYYGQRHTKEIESADKVTEYYGVEHISLDLEKIFQYSDCSLLAHSDKEIPEESYAEQIKKTNGSPVSTYVPFRNGLFLSSAASIALSKGCEVIYYGAHSDDAAGSAYPDCSDEFNKAMNEAIYLGSGKQLKIEAPFINKTKAGQAMLAVSEDKGAAQLMGINVNKTISMTFAIGSALAAIAGVLLCSAYPSLTPYTGSMPGIKAFVAAVFGGIGSVPGALIGGIILGIIEILGKAYISSQLADAIVFAVLIVVLLVKPTGILGKNIQEKV